ncbi:MAG TPA: hypothetical protein VGI74_09545 [Streptosporangiaceae bacterium]|jgi:hypothetical protein
MTDADIPDRDVPDRRDIPLISDASLAALLAGARLPAGSAPRLRPLAESLAGLTDQPSSGELDGEAQTLAAFRKQFASARQAGRSRRRWGRLLPRPLPVKSAAAAMVAAIFSLGGFAATAYAGALPAPLQRLAHEIIAAPAPDGQPAPRPSTATPAVTGPAAYSLCTAWAQAKAHGSDAQQAVAFGKLAAAAGGADHVAAYCAAATRAGSPPSGRPHPARTPGGSGKPSGLPSPRGSGKPTGLPAPGGSGKPSGLPSPRGSGKPTGLPAPGGSGKPSGLPSPRGSGKPTGLPTSHGTGKPGGSPAPRGSGSPAPG